MARRLAWALALGAMVGSGVASAQHSRGGSSHGPAPLTPPFNTPSSVFHVPPSVGPAPSAAAASPFPFNPGPPRATNPGGPPPAWIPWGGGWPVLGGPVFVAPGWGPFVGSPVIGPPFGAAGPAGGFPLAADVPRLGAMLPGPPPGFAREADPRPARSARTDPARGRERMTFGDRLFRVGNLARAAERYAQAARDLPVSAAPRIRQAQVAFVRGRYAEAAAFLRDAQAAEPGWLAQAPDVQALFAEPADFARHLADLEAHLQAHPTDRDAWLVLGAELFLSNRTRKAADVFLRLTDRAGDETLDAFVAASRAQE